MLNMTSNRGVAAEVPLRVELLHELLERQVLVGVGAEGDLAHPPEQLAEARIAPEARCAARAC